MKFTKRTFEWIAFPCALLGVRKRCVAYTLQERSLNKRRLGLSTFTKRDPYYRHTRQRQVIPVMRGRISVIGRLQLGNLGTEKLGNGE